LVMSILGLIFISIIRPDVWNNYFTNIWAYIFPVIGYCGIFGMIYYTIYTNALKGFIFSSLFIAGMLSTTAYSLYPNLLISTIDPKNNLTIYNSITGEYAMNIASKWWIGGMVLVIIYFIYIYYKFRGRVKIEDNHY